MFDAMRIQEHMEVKGSDGMHVGAVDHVEGHRIKLTKNDPAAGGQHHFIDMDLVDDIEGSAVKLSCTAAEAKQQWIAA